jgi:deoxycytidylate deaminase
LVGSAWNEELGGDEKGLRPGSSQRRPYGNNIGGILVDSQSNRIIGWGLNMKHLNKCYHGETLLILHYLSTKNVDRLPDGSLFYTSLEPCHMCSGFITTVGGDSGHFRSNRRTGLRQKCIAARMWPEWVVCSMQANRIQNAGLHDSRSDEKKSESKNDAVSV